MILTDLDYTDHPPPSGETPTSPAPRLLLVPPPIARTLTAAEALALVVAPRPLVVALHLLLHPKLLTAWWGVVFRGMALFVRLDDGHGVPAAGRAELNTAALVDLVSADAPELVTELDVEELAHRTNPGNHDARPWVVLDGPALGRLLLQREALHRLMAAGAGLGTPTWQGPQMTAPTDRARAWVVRADLTMLGRPGAEASTARTLVVDGGDWIALATAVVDGPVDDATTIRCDRATLTDHNVDAHDRRPVTLPAGWP